MAFFGSKGGELLDLRSKSEENNRKALEMLLAVLNTFPQYLLPDLIDTDDRVLDHIKDLVNKQYPNLKKITISGDSGHRGHFHIAFSPYRSGNYQDYLEDVGNEAGQEQRPVTDFFRGTIVKNIPVFDTNQMSFLTSSKGQLKGDDRHLLYKALITYGGFWPETAAIFMMIAERESNIGLRTLYTGGGSKVSEFSYTLWQFNYIGNSDKALSKIPIHNVNAPNLSSPQIVEGYKLVFSDWQSLNIVGNTSEKTKRIRDICRERGKSAIDLFDPRVFTPINQINILVDYVKQYTYSRFKNGWKFSNWGEYQGAPKYGWIRDLKFDTAVYYFTHNNPGYTKEDLQKHVRSFYFNKKGQPPGNVINPEGREKLEEWLSGKVF